MHCLQSSQALLRSTLKKGKKGLQFSRLAGRLVALEEEKPHGARVHIFVVGGSGADDLRRSLVVGACKLHRDQVGSESQTPLGG